MTKQMSLRLAPAKILVSRFVTDEELETMVDKTGNFNFAGRISSNPPSSFQYRWGRKVQPKDWSLLDKLPL